MKMPKFMPISILALALSAPIALAPNNTSAQVARPLSCPASGAASVGELHRQWILVGWEKKVGDAPFDFRAKLGKYYDWSGRNVVLYDDFDPQHRVARSAAEYAAIWTPAFSALRTAYHRVIDGPDVVTWTGDLATSTLEFAARLEAQDGKITGIRTRSSVVWRCGEDAWKIVREHNSSRVVSAEEIGAIFARPANKPITTGATQ